MFLLVTGRAQSRSRTDEPIRTQRDYSRTRDSPITTQRSARHHAKESDSSNNYAPIIVGPLTTNQDLTNAHGEKIYNLPLMIQQPFLREKKEPIKVDISVKLIPKPRKRDKKRRESHVDEIVSPDRDKGVKNSISMEVTDRNVHVLKEIVEIVDGKDKVCTPVEIDKDKIRSTLVDESKENNGDNLPISTMYSEDVKHDNLNRLSDSANADDITQNIFNEDAQQPMVDEFQNDSVNTEKVEAVNEIVLKNESEQVSQEKIEQ